MELLRTYLANGIKTISFNVPDKKNPLTPQSMDLLNEALDACEKDGTKVVILKGEGNNFCSGAMLEPKMLQGDFDVTDYLSEKVNPVIIKMRELPQPIIAQVQGVCVGLGFSLALACDLIFAGESARFSQIFTRIGLASDGGGAYFLLKTIGYQRAFHLIANNVELSAQRALALGIANQVVTDGELHLATQEMAQKLAKGPGVALAAVKRNLQTATLGNLSVALREEASNQGVCFQTKDFKEGVTAFMEKRQANFEGK